MKLLTLTALTIFATTSGALADNKLSYSCYYKKDGKTEHKDGYTRPIFETEHKDGGVVSYAEAKYIIAKMRTWSGSKYVVKYDIGAREIAVKCRMDVKSKEAALEAMAEQERIVKEQKGQRL